MAISIRGLSFAFYNSERKSLDGIDLSVGEGEFVAITGPSGCGKSTLAAVIGGYIPHVIEGKLQGAVNVCGYDTAKASLPDFATLVGIVQQDPESQLCTLSVDDEVAFGPENLALPPEEVQKRIDESLALAMADHLRGRCIFELSGGEKQRVAIASVLAMKPSVLILDEPTSNLDPSSTAEVLAAISLLKARTGLTVLVIEHKLDKVLPFADRLIVMDQGKIVLDGQPDDVLGTYRSKMSKIGILLPDRSIRHYPAVAAKAHNETIQIAGLSFAYAGKEVLHDISFTASPGEIIGILGPNGSGKTTFLNHLLGINKPGSGTVVVTGADTRSKKISALARKVGYVFQNPNHQLFERTVEAEAAFACINFGIPREETDRRVQAELEQYGLSRYASRHPLGLSFGEKRRLNLCSVLPHGPDIIVLDEPFVGQDYINIARMMSDLEALRAAGKTVILVSHDIDMAYRYCDRIVLFSDGNILADDSPGEAERRIRALGFMDYVPGAGR